MLSRKEKIGEICQSGDYDHLIAEATSIGRFEGFEHILNESLDIHIFNCRRRSTMLLCDDQTWETVDRILYLHDLHELDTGDTLAYEVDEASELAARQAAKKLGPIESDLRLVEQFITAEKALKTGVVDGELTSEAVLAKVIDLWDGTEVFHIKTPYWMSTVLYKPEKIPPNEALTYAIDASLTYMKNIENLELDEGIKNTALGILNISLDWIVAHWSQVPKERIPLFMQERLKVAASEIAGFKEEDTKNYLDYFPLTLF